MFGFCVDANVKHFNNNININDFIDNKLDLNNILIKIKELIEIFKNNLPQNTEAFKHLDLSCILNIKLNVC
jgi:hypothetical protein